MKNQLDKEEENEKLQHFIFSIDDKMDTFIEGLAIKNYHLDFTLESLNDIEDYLISEKISNNDNKVDERSNCWIYLGEVFRKEATTAIWEVSLNKENTANYGLYVLKGYSDKDLEFVPIRYINAFLLKKQKGFLVSVISNHLKPVQVNLDQFPTEKD